MDFEQRLQRAAERGQRKRDAKSQEEAAKAMSQEECKRLHSKYRLELSDHVETCLKQLADQFPGFNYKPVMGEKGVYFVERAGGGQVHPFYGWDQGHFLVEPDLATGEEVVRTRDGRAIYALDEDLPTPRSAAGLSTGTASGMRLLRRGAGESPLTVEAFKLRLRNLLEGSGR